MGPGRPGRAVPDLPKVALRSGRQSGVESHLGAKSMTTSTSTTASLDPWHGLMVSASGVRGIVGEALTPDVVTRFAGAHGSFLGPGPVVTGRDSRPSGAWVLRGAQAALLATGHDVIDVGIAPTPTILFAIRGHDAA